MKPTKYIPKDIPTFASSEAKAMDNKEVSAGEGRRLKYDPKLIEQKWQEVWEKNGLYTYVSKSKKQKFYTLVELPYPSGDLHIGHWFAFTTPDVLSRYLRMNDREVFFPMGYDAFGLPAENAAIKRNIHPQDWTMSNIASMTRQFKTMGTMIDWSKVVITCLPEYYRWNQYIFIQLYKKGLAYRGEVLSNWCPVDQTVLANEHVENGKCWRCGAEVVQKEVAQWFLKITDYADKLEWQKDGNGVDWPKSVMAAQNEWIGRKEGMKITHHMVNMDLTFQTFTAYSAWSWADTYIVMAPEHPLVKELVSGTEYEKNVMAFVEEMSKESEMERKETNEKKGVFTGRYAKDPFGGPDMPIWLANFALMNFGTGIIRCSAHDPRDVAFAEKYNITIKQVVDGVDDVPANAHNNKGILKDSGPFTGREVGEIREEVMEWIEKQGFGERFINYHLHDWSISRQRYWGTPVPMIHCEKCGIVPVPEDQLPITLPYDVDYAPKGKAPLASNEEWMKVDCPQCGGKATRDPETLDTFFDSSWYYYRYVSPQDDKEPFDKEKVKELMPVDVYFGGSEHTLGHTLYARFFTKVFNEWGWVDFNEFAKKRIQHGVVLGPDGNRMSKSKGNVVNPDDVVKEFGTDAVRLYLTFMMPYEATGPWSTDSLYGVYRFLKRVWDMQSTIVDYEMDPEDLYQMHRTIAKVSRDIQEIHMNTAVAAMMEWLNYLSRKGKVHREEYRTLILLLAPFAPHMTEEIYQNFFRNSKFEALNSKQTDELTTGELISENRQLATDNWSIHQQSWPVSDKKYLDRQTNIIIIQVNGKMRGEVEMQSAQSTEQTEVEKIVAETEAYKKWVGENTPKKIIFVPGKIINFVI